MSNNVNECRVCFEHETEDNPFIQPCACKGTSRYIHLVCLEKWRHDADNPLAKKKCMECGKYYLFSRLHPLELNPFEKSLIISTKASKCFVANFGVIAFNSMILYYIDHYSQASFTVFSFGNEWYNQTIKQSIRNGESEIIIPYYLSLSSFIYHQFVFLYFYIQIYRKIVRKRQFYNYILYEIIFLNILAYNFLIIFWSCYQIGAYDMTAFLMILFLMAGCIGNLIISPALSTLCKSGIRFVNEKNNPETILNVVNNPVNTVIEFTNMEQKYEALDTEYDEMEDEKKTDIM